MTDQPDKQLNQPAVPADKAEQPAPPPSKPEPAVEKPTSSPAAESAPETKPPAKAEAVTTASSAPPAPPATETKSAPPAPVPQAAPIPEAKPADQPAAEPAKSVPFIEPPLTPDTSKKPDLPSVTTTALPPPPEVKPAAPSPARTAPVDDLLATAKPAAPSAGQICPNCGHRNRPGILLCENCGTNLMTGKQISVGTRDLKRDAETGSLEGADTLDTGQTKAIESAGSGTFTENMVLRIEIEGAGTPMLVYPKQEIILGRRDPNTGAMPDVDLTAYAGYRMGVSRSHAAIRFQDKQLHVSDLGSSNGTFLNGTRLNAHRPYQLRDGDEVRLGQMVLRLFFQANRK